MDRFRDAISVGPNVNRKAGMRRDENRLGLGKLRCPALPIIFRILDGDAELRQLLLGICINGHDVEPRASRPHVQRDVPANASGRHHDSQQFTQSRLVDPANPKTGEALCFVRFISRSSPNERVTCVNIGPVGDENEVVRNSTSAFHNLAVGRDQLHEGLFII